jgi:hypothetical protein
MSRYTRRKTRKHRAGSTVVTDQRGGANNETPTLENVLGIAAGVGYKREVLPTSGALSTRSRSNYLTGLYRNKAIKQEKAKQKKLKEIIEPEMRHIRNLYIDPNSRAPGFLAATNLEIKRHMKVLVTALKKYKYGLSVSTYAELFQLPYSVGYTLLKLYPNLVKGAYEHSDEILQELQADLNEVKGDIREEQKEWQRGENYPYGHVKTHTKRRYAFLQNAILKLQDFLQSYNPQRAIYSVPIMNIPMLNSVDRYNDDSIYNYQESENNYYNNNNNYNNYNNQNNANNGNNNYGNAMRQMYGNNNA